MSLPAASSVHHGETLEQSEASASAAVEVPRRLEEPSAQDGAQLFLVLIGWEGHLLEAEGEERPAHAQRSAEPCWRRVLIGWEGHLLRPVVDLVVQLEDEHLDEDDEADEGEGAARLRQDALVVAGDVG